MSLTPRPLVFLALAACSVRPYDVQSTASDTSADTSTSAPQGSTTSLTPTTTAPPDITTTATTTGPDTGTGGVPAECDQWLEDCPDGQKCTFYSGDGDDNWESRKCVPVVPDPDGLGEPCTVSGFPASGEDTCDKHMMCVFVDLETLAGTCVAMCDGTIDQPACAHPKTSCLILGNDYPTLCLPLCAPLLQDCPDGGACSTDPGNPYFQCHDDPIDPPGPTFAACAGPHNCAPGLFCTDPAQAAECDPMADGCCLPFCDLTQPNTCPGAGQECVPWFPPGLAPVGCEDVGGCGLTE